jgi:hypothetical protein
MKTSHFLSDETTRSSMDAEMCFGWKRPSVLAGRCVAPFKQKLSKMKLVSKIILKEQNQLLPLLCVFVCVCRTGTTIDPASQ